MSQTKKECVYWKQKGAMVRYNMGFAMFSLKSKMARFPCDSFLVSKHHVQADVSTSLYVAQVLDLLLAHVMGT